MSLFTPSAKQAFSGRIASRVMVRAGELTLAALLAIACGESTPRRVSHERSQDGSSAMNSSGAAAGAALEHWCYSRGDGAKIKVAPCFDTEATCKNLFSRMDTYDVIEPCHFRSPVFCYDTLRGDVARPQCFASMQICAGHWEVSRQYPQDGEHLGPGCTERSSAAGP